jgi:hypothetical protein
MGFNDDLAQQQFWEAHVRASFLPQPHRLKCDHGCQENPKF